MAFLLKPILYTISTACSKKCFSLYRVVDASKNSVGFSSIPAGKVQENSDVSTITPVFQIATHHLNKVALNDKNGLHTYQEILRKSLMLAKKIQEKIGITKTQERIVFLCPNDVTYILAQWACWASGHIGECIFYTFK